MNKLASQLDDFYTDYTAVPSVFPESWASAWGQDEQGLWMAFEYKGVEQIFRWIHPGRFLMGSPEQEQNRYKNEAWHRVVLTEGYWLADTTCAQALWQAVMGKNPSKFIGGKRPVEKVNWEGAIGLIDTLNGLLPALGLRLPTEAEWEYACRAMTSTPFSFGENITPEQVNYDGNYPYSGGEGGRNRRETVEIKSLSCNSWGLYEMHGNVWEWCQDWYGQYPQEEVVNPTGPNKGGGRVLRGGSWFHDARYVRSACRHFSTPGLRSFSTGFRLARG